MFGFEWLTRGVSDAVVAGIKDALERMPHILGAPAPPRIEAAAEISPRAIASDSEPVNGKRIAKAGR